MSPSGRTIIKYVRLAQLGEHLAYNQGVGSSSLSPRTILKEGIKYEKIYTILIKMAIIKPNLIFMRTKLESRSLLKYNNCQFNWWLYIFLNR